MLHVVKPTQGWSLHTRLSCVVCVCVLSSSASAECDKSERATTQMTEKKRWDDTSVLSFSQPSVPVLSAHLPPSLPPSLYLSLLQCSHNLLSTSIFGCNTHTHTHQPLPLSHSPFTTVRQGQVVRGREKGTYTPPASHPATQASSCTLRDPEIG